MVKCFESSSVRIFEYIQGKLIYNTFIFETLLCNILSDDTLNNIDQMQPKE